MKALLSAALAAALVCAGAAACADPCSADFCGGAHLGPFFDKLEAVGPHQPGVRPLSILMIGDSHSANDNIAGAWREMLQERYGSGGRGVLPPGTPWADYHLRGVTVAQSPSWQIESTMDRAYRELTAHALFGISGFRLSTASAGASLALTADTPEFEFDRLIVCAVNGPDAGAYDLTFDGTTTHVDLHADAARVACATFQATGFQSTAQLSVTAGPLTLTSWGSFRDDGGVTVSNLGVVGAQVSNFAETDDEADQAELDAYQPDLIVLEFGTNDGFVGHFDADSFEAMLRAQIRRLKRLSHGAPILVLGAPDADTNRRDLVANAPAQPGDPPPAAGAWFPPPGLAAVRQVQRRVAASMDVAFWDWSSRMGGPGTANLWAAADPPLMHKADHVHYTVAGGARIAQLLEQDLDAARAAYILSAD